MIPVLLFRFSSEAPCQEKPSINWKPLKLQSDLDRTDRKPVCGDKQPLRLSSADDSDDNRLMDELWARLVLPDSRRQTQTCKLNRKPFSGDQTETPPRGDRDPVK